MVYNKVVDADAHVLEPMDLWEHYLEKKYQPRGIFFRTTPDGADYLEIDGKRMFPPGQDRYRSRRGLGNLGGIAGYPDMDRVRQQARERFTYLDGAPPGSMDPHERVKHLDQEGIDVAVVYPTVGLIWEEHTADPGLSAALTRAYNNWLVDFCKPYPKRLFSVAHISLDDVESAIDEIKRMAKLGARGLFFRPGMVNGRTLGHRDYDPIWATAQDLGLAVAPHVVVRSTNLPLKEWFASWVDPESGRGFTPLGLATMLPIMASFYAVMANGVFERFPRLKYVILETGGGWIAHCIERMDSKWKMRNAPCPLKEKPAFYFRRQCFISVDPDEMTTPAMVQLLGEDKFIWASDFPHIDAEYGVVKELKEHISDLSETAQRKILGENAANIYNLPR